MEKPLLSRSDAVTKWEQPIELDEVLRLLKSDAEAMAARGKASVPILPDGHTEEEIDARESAFTEPRGSISRLGIPEFDADIDRRQLDRPIPAPIRRLYRTVGGTEGHYNDIRLLTLSSCDWADTDDLAVLFRVREGSTHPGWRTADFFRIADSVHMGDMIAYCCDPPRGRPGAIVLVEEQFRNHFCDPVVVLGDSLAQWLDRWRSCGYQEFACYPGGAWDISAELERSYLEDHLRLNPDGSWARERLASL